jgi:hypothetical protein
MITGRDGWAYSYHDPGLMAKASTMAWVENFLNFTNGYYKITSSEGDQFEYLVPFPPGLTSTMKAHWTTDVIVLNPSCSWQTATITGPFNDGSQYVKLPESNLGFTLLKGQLGMFLLSSNVFVCLLDFSITER